MSPSPAPFDVAWVRRVRFGVLAAVPGAPAGLRYAVYLPSGWTSLGAATSGTTVALDQLSARRTLPWGFRVGTGSLTTATLEVDYIELTLRYR